MRRAGGLFRQICGLENLREAAAKALRGKRDRGEVRAFVAGLDRNLAELSEQIGSGTVALGRFQQFVNHDPKKRMISAPAFRERVVHHAVMNVCEPVFERFAIRDSYACRVGGGQFAALARAREFSRGNRFFLKLDVRKYFESIPKARLLEKLRRRFREEELLGLFGRILGSFEPEKGHGVPIGSLTSQHFANFYLGYVDRHVKETLRVRGYVRYMDDFVLWGSDRTELRGAARSLEEYVWDDLELTLKPAVINPVSVGMEFLGHRVYPEGNRLSRRSRRRFRKRVETIERGVEQGVLSERGAQERLDSLLAFTRHSACVKWRRGVLFPLGSRPETAPTA